MRRCWVQLRRWWCRPSFAEEPALDGSDGVCRRCGPPAAPGSFKVRTELVAALFAQLSDRPDDAHALVSAVPEAELHAAVVMFLENLGRFVDNRILKLDLEAGPYLQGLLLLAARSEAEEGSGGC